MFEKIISKNTEDETSRMPPAPRASTPAPPADLLESSKPVAISAGQRNVLLPDVEIQGEVRFENDLIVDGKIEGKISSLGSLTIGEPAKIKAEINCGSVIVHGKVQGNITVKDRVEIRSKAEVIGNIKANALVMEAGAIFVGASTIGTPKNRPAAKPSGGGDNPSPQKDKNPVPSSPAGMAQSSS
ncbi:MAG: polymer-forming cytoskeletal protein [Roseibacillus sp.]